MKKFFPENILKTFDQHKQLKALYDLAQIIEQNQLGINSNEFNKLKQYHEFLANSSHDFIQRANKEFIKVKEIDRQFQIYLMNLERFLGHSTKEYDFIVNTTDKNNSSNDKSPIICILDSIRSAHNVGSIFRNAECFNVEKIFLCGLTPNADHPSVIKTAMGTTNLVDWEYKKDILELVKNLKAQGVEIIGVETGRNSTKLEDFSKKSEKIALIFGHEVYGLSLDVIKNCDQILKIELFGSKNSLNVAISNAICLNFFKKIY